jgi:hypothetical protein
MSRRVDVSFDCLPLRMVGRLDVPLDASPRYRARCERIRQALEKHGAFNTYYLYNAECTFFLTNDEATGSLQFSFDGIVLTDSTDQRTERCDLDVQLVRETCDWLTEPIVEWFRGTVTHAVRVEFDRYIAAGDRDQAVERIQRIQAQSDEHGGYVGMYL